MLRVALIQILKNQLAEINLQIEIMTRGSTSGLYMPGDLEEAKLRKKTTVETITYLQGG